MRLEGVLMNEFEKIFAERCINIRAFCRVNDITPTTLYSIISGKTNPKKIGIDVWIKIAHGLGVTADELYEIVFKRCA